MEPVGRVSRHHADDAAFLASSYGLTPYEWQSLVLGVWLAERPDGRWASARCGLAVPRQNGKNAVLEIVELYKLVVLGRTILHTAHQVRTAALAFHRLAAFFENERQYPELAKMLLKVSRTNGKEAIILRNGASIAFVARSRTAGRGFTVDDLVMDEAQILAGQAMAALMPSLSAAPSGNPQVVFTGTPPGPEDDGSTFERARTAALEGTDSGASWLEWSVAGTPDLDDRRTWAAANPGLDVGRVLWDVVEGERATLTDEAFQRERLGMWATEVVQSVFDPETWRARATVTPPTRGPKAFGVDMSPDRRTASIGAARLDEATGMVHVEVVANDSTTHGAGWVTQWLTSPDRGDVAAVVVDGMSPAASLLTPLIDAGVPVVVTGPQDMVRACGGFYDAVVGGSLTHFDQAPLNRAVSVAKRRSIGSEGGWGWNRRGPGGDITALVAVTLAAHGLVGRPAPVKRTGRAIFA